MLCGKNEKCEKKEMGEAVCTIAPVSRAWRERGMYKPCIRCASD